ncbi:MAG: hypothetical protein ABIL09_19820, partial [Gemmatimonadota bacterium]
MTASRRAHRGGQSRPTVRQFRPTDAEGASAVMIEAFRSFLPARNRRTVLEGFAADRLRGTSTFGQKGATTATY